MNSFIILAIVLIPLILVGLWWLMTYNSLIAKRNRVDQCQSGICVSIQQRNDMIPNLVAAVKAYMGHESSLLTRIAELRARGNEGSEAEQIKNGNEISALLGQLRVAVESYPDLKANEQFLHLQSQIEDMERELQAVRRTFNAVVTDYNNAIDMFPSSLVASAARHTRRDLIALPESEQKNVDVKSLFQ